MSRKSDYEIFINKYKPLMDGDDIKRFETFGEEWKEAKRLSGNDCEFLWTIVEAGDKWYIYPGFHHINRLFYIITENPWNEKSRDYLY